MHIRLINEIVDVSADKTPDAIAFRCLEQNLSFSELAARAAKLAAVLTSQGVRPGDRVGVYLRKSVETPVAIYGIMRAGAAYVPLDATAPPERTRRVLQHCGIRHLVSSPGMQGHLKLLLSDGPPLLDSVIGLSGGALDIETIGWDDVATAEMRPPAARIDLDIAYVMFTSGSTGTPKGIVHTHRSGLSYARAAIDVYGVTSEDRLANHSPLHFDMSTFEYFSAPLAGATTIIIPEAYTKLPASLSQLMQDERVTYWYSVPYALIQLLELGVLEDRDLSALRWVIFGGEPFQPKNLAALMRLWPHARFSNNYGPAEVNQCSYYHLEGPPESDTESIPIGKVWENSSGLILDDDGNEADEGELMICSSSMMRGYWDAEELTRRAFYQRDITPGVAQTYLRTGDLVRDTGDGVMRFLGRKDRQIKVRGYRVELDEVELALSSHPAVEEAGAFLGAGDTVIQAGVSLRDTSIEAGDILRHAGQHLASYAVPSEVFIVTDFPRTGTGKIDRPALKERFDTSE